MRRGIGILGISITVLAVPLIAFGADSDQYRAIESVNVGGGVGEGSQYRAIESVNFYPANIFEFDQNTATDAAVDPPENPSPSTGQLPAPILSPVDSPPQDGNAAVPSSTTGGILGIIGSMWLGIGNVAEGVREAVAAVVDTPLALPAQLAVSAATFVFSAGLFALPGLAPVLGSSGVGSSAVGFSAAFPSTVQWVNWLIGWPRRRRGYGRVFATGSGKPIAGATVRLIAEGVAAFSAGKLVGTTQTDANGLYQLVAARGEYRIEVVADGYVFPSKYSAVGYRGGHVTTDVLGRIAVDIGVDGHSVAVPYAAHVLDGFLHTVRSVRLPVMAVGTVLSVLFLLSRGGWVDGLVTAGYVVLWLQERFVFAGRGRSGRILVAGKPAPASVVRVYSVASLIATRVTDGMGMFSVFVPAGEYRIDVQRTGSGIRTTTVRQRQTGELHCKLNLESQPKIAT